MLGPGYLHAEGSQIVDEAGAPVRIVGIGWGGTDASKFSPDGLFAFNYQASMRSMVDAGFNTIRIPWSDALLRGGSPAPGRIDYRLNPDMQGLDAIGVLQKLVAYAGKIGLKVIFDHHDNESSGGQQKNGLWYDVGGASDGTDGSNRAGTVSQQNFLDDWVRFARLWAGNATVIGFDLDNEPGAATWGGPLTTSIQQMATSVGNAIQAVDPGALIIVEPGSTSYAPDGDLTQAQPNPVLLNAPNKVVYSVHEYPWMYFGNDQQYVLQLNNAWGYLVRQNVAPVWIGEMGSSLQSDKDRGWASALLRYLNGADAGEGGPEFVAGQQGVSGDWWAWAGYPSGDPDGILQTDWKTFRADQLGVAQQLEPDATQYVAALPGGANGPVDTLQLWMSEDAYQGDAHFAVALDGQMLAARETVTATNSTFSVEPFTFTGPFGEGQHELTITFLNDRSDGAPDKDRNLDLKYVVWNGETVPGPGLHLNRNGPKTFSFASPAPVSRHSADSAAPITSVPVFRFWSDTNGEHFYTASAAERDNVLATRSDMHYEGVGFRAVDSKTDPSAVPVYRFLESTDGSHFFTASTAERDTVIATRPDLTYEGIGFYERAAGSGSPVYRFLATADGGHFYTASAQERDGVSATRPDLHYEGVAFYAPS